jgi:site-specific DNA-methyltransferase (adenine-specific)
MNPRVAAGTIRDSIFNYLSSAENASLAEIREAISTRLGSAVATSSVRSYLNLNTPELFERTSRGHYRLSIPRSRSAPPEYVVGRARLIQSNCLDWLRTHEARSIHAVITDPPYGLMEYSAIQQAKLRRKRGGVWRIPPSFDGHQRAPLPTFTVLNEGDRALLCDFFLSWVSCYFK